MAQNNGMSKGKNILITMGMVIVIGIVILVVGMGIGVSLFSDTEEDTLLSRFNLTGTATEISIPLEEFIINLVNESPSGQSYVRLEITVTALEGDAEKIIENDIAKVRDAVIHVVSDETSETLYEETDEDFKIKDEIKDRINEVLHKEVVEEVYLTNILLQR